MNKNSDGGTYFSLKEMVREVFLSALEGKGLNAYQAFGYAYDEVEVIFSEGDFQNLCLLVAIFICVEDSNLVLDLGDPFTQDVVGELKSIINKMDENADLVWLDPRYGDGELVADIGRLRGKYFP
ncbi:hypothetical protein B7R78_0005945 [Ralstonia solanacearum]|uniref:hypothetical protein n=1 Tax=Ralstonia solanacearum TaxID=305 RepID=UPI00114130DC|nr:hypothetical protein [Ralstonia solanacearum]MBT1536475.1 hypothetical protein [Ralstonia solanacearum]MBT1536676.1 hypothetical protein [Ralstonia solanacearum]